MRSRHGGPAPSFLSALAAVGLVSVLVVLAPVDAATVYPRIAAAGDIACDPASSSYNGGNGTATLCRHKFTSNLLYGAGYSKVLGLGDIQYENGARSKFDVSYAPTWGRVKSITRPVPGNHEYYTSGASGYFSYFGTLAGSASKGYYSYNVGSWHLIALNSNCSKVGGCGAGSVQEKWLRADLKAYTNRCTLAYWHHPRFSSGQHGNNSATAAFWNALYQYNADIVLVAHDHTYERFAPQTPSALPDPLRGIRQFVVGTGGKSSYTFPTVRANSQVRHTGTYGVLEMTLKPTSYAFRFRPEAGKTFTDSGSGNCH